MTHEEATRDARLRRIAADMFISATRRGWLENKNMSEHEYVEQFVEQCKDRDLDELEEGADIARPSNMPTAHERMMMWREMKIRRRRGKGL